MDERSVSIRKASRLTRTLLVARPAAGRLFRGPAALALGRGPAVPDPDSHVMGHCPHPHDACLHAAGSIRPLSHRVHAWGGWLILAFAVVRIGLRYLHGVPPLPAASSQITRWDSGYHALLYGLLFALPITGTGAMYVNSAAFAPIHRVLIRSLLAVAAVHAAAALWHHLIRRDEVLRRMITGVRTAK